MDVDDDEFDLPVFRHFTRDDLADIHHRLFENKLLEKKKAEKLAKNKAVSLNSFSKFTGFFLMEYHINLRFEDDVVFFIHSRNLEREQELGKTTKMTLTMKTMTKVNQPDQIQNWHKALTFRNDLVNFQWRCQIFLSVTLIHTSMTN
jgi:hypothetical protein